MPHTSQTLCFPAAGSDPVCARDSEEAQRQDATCRGRESVLGLSLCGERGQPQPAPQQWGLLGASLLGCGQTQPREARGGCAGSRQLLPRWYQERLMLS